MIVTILLWITLLFLIYFVDPESFAAIPLFLFLSFAALLFTFAVILNNLRRGIIISVSTAIFLILRYFGVGNILNLLLITGIAVALELYFWYTSEK